MNSGLPEGAGAVVEQAASTATIATAASRAEQLIMVVSLWVSPGAAREQSYSTL